MSEASGAESAKDQSRVELGGGPYRGSGHPGALVDRNPGAAERIPGDQRPEGLRLRLIALAWNFMWELARRLPERAAFGLGRVLAPVSYWLARGHREQVRRNLARVLGAGVDRDTLERAVRAAFRSYARYWVEAFRAADISPEDLDDRTTTDGFEHLDAALDAGKGAIILLAHHGSWDIAARWAETHGYHLAVVAEVVRPRALFQKFVRLREEIGLEVVPLRRGGDVSQRLQQVLQANHMVGLLSDRDLTSRGPVVKLFGETCRLPQGPVVLSRRSEAPILPVTMLQQPQNRWHARMFPPVDVTSGSVEDGCEAVAEALERIIELAPEQWHAFSPVWLADVPEHRRGELPRRDIGTS